MSTPINIPGARRRDSVGSNSTGSYKTGSPLYYNISPPNIKTSNIDTYKSMKQYKDSNPDKAFNISDFFQQLSTDSYILNIKKDKFYALKNIASMGGKDYNYKINFTVNRNWLALYTDFILFKGDQVEHVAVVCNEKIIYEKEFPYSAETMGFFLSRPNVLPLLAMPLLKFKMSIFIYSKNSKALLIYTEIKVKPELQSIICMLDRWYVVSEGRRIFFNGNVEDKDCVDNLWEILNRMPDIKRLNFTNSI